MALGAENSTELEVLYRVQRDPMVRLARLMTGSRATAEEVVQEAFLRVAPRISLVDNPEGYPEIDEMWAAICRLPFSQRAVLALRFYEDLSEDDIARTLDCRLGTVKGFGTGVANQLVPILGRQGIWQLPPGQFQSNF